MVRDRQRRERVRVRTSRPLSPYSLAYTFTDSLRAAPVVRHTGMTDCRRRAVRAGFLLAILAVHTGLACTVPVFRYALELWEPDNYIVVLLHRDSLTARDQQILGRFLDTAANRPAANIRVCPVDISADSLTPRLDSLRRQYGDEPLPHMVLCAPARGELGEPIWSGALTITNVDRIRGSPARRTVAEAILSGAVCVWVAITDSDTAATHAALDTLQQATAQLEAQVRLPELAPEDAHVVRRGYTPGGKLRCATVTVSRDDPAEEVLINMIMAHHPELARAPGPVLAPFFGRGRMLYPLAGRDILRKAVLWTGRFLAGPCACTVKHRNPGHDIVFDADWHSAFSDSAVGHQMPALKGLSAFSGDARR